MRYSHHTLPIAIAVLIITAMAVKAENTPKMKMKSSEIKSMAEQDMDAAGKDVKGQMEQNKEQIESMKKQQMKKAEEMKKEAGKGSDKGQTMREEHSRKWWKFWGEKQPAAE